MHVQHILTLYTSSITDNRYFSMGLLFGTIGEKSKTYNEKKKNAWTHIADCYKFSHNIVALSSACLNVHWRSCMRQTYYARWSNCLDCCSWSVSATYQPSGTCTDWETLRQVQSAQNTLWFRFKYHFYTKIKAVRRYTIKQANREATIFEGSWRHLCRQELRREQVFVRSWYSFFLLLFPYSGSLPVAFKG